MRADAREVDRKGRAQSKVIIKEGLHVIQSPSKRYMVPVCVSSQEASTIPLHRNFSTEKLQVEQIN